MLRVLIKFGLTYEYMNFISLFVGAIAATIFVYKAPFNKLSKTLLLFSPPFLYYSAVFARPYIFTVLFTILVCVFYKDRHKHPYIFGSLLFCLFNTHLLTTPLIGSIILIEIYEYFKDKKYLKERITIFVLAFLGGLFFAIQIVPSVGLRGDLMHVKPIIELISQVLYSAISISSGFFTFNRVVTFIGFVLFLIFLTKINDNKKVIFILLFNIIFYVFFTFFVYTMNEMKCVFMFCIFLFAMWVYVSESKIRKEPTRMKKNTYKFFIALLALASLNTAVLVVNDIFYDYSYAKSVSNYLKEDKRENIKILTLYPYPDIKIMLDDRYTFINFVDGKEYTYVNYGDNNNSRNNYLYDYIKASDFDYFITYVDHRYTKHQTDALVKEGVLEKVHKTDVIKGLVTANVEVYKVHLENNK
jgi:hypothetical protein